MDFLEEDDTVPDIFSIDVSENNYLPSSSDREKDDENAQILHRRKSIRRNDETEAFPHNKDQVEVESDKTKYCTNAPEVFYPVEE